jgi:hypothetical protein
MAKKKVIDLDTYNALDAWAISLHEMYRALIRAGFRSDIAMGIIMERDAYPDWILPAKPIEKIGSIDPDEYEDDD